MSRSSEQLQVSFEKVTRDDEGAYEVRVKADEGKVDKKFDYVLVVMGEKNTRFKTKIIKY